MTKKQEQALKEMPQTGFHFSEEAHLYVLDGKPLTGVTTILGVIAKPALIQWSADEAVKFLGWMNPKYESPEKIAESVKAKLSEIKELDEQGFLTLLSDARVQHAKRKKDAASTGTDSHSAVEEIVKKAIVTVVNGGKLDKTLDYSNTESKTVETVVNSFIKWAVDNDITFLESEKRLYSKKHWYAGTCDLVFLKDGKKFVGDIKTSSGIYGREYFFQMAGYQIALEEQGFKDFFGSTVIRCGKDGSFEVKDSFDLESDKAGFLAALKLYRELEK